MINDETGTPDVLNLLKSGSGTQILSVATDVEDYDGTT